MLRQSTTYGTKYCVRQIVHKTTGTDINSRVAVIVRLDFRNLKSTKKIKTIKFLKYKISICLDHTYMYIVLRVPYACNFKLKPLQIVLYKVSIVEAIKYQNKDDNRFAVLTAL